MQVVLTYDVVDDSDRARFHRHLQRWLVRVQRSVFEGDAGRGTLDAIDALARRDLDLSVDSVRVYVLCAACSARTRCLGIAAPLPDPDLPIVW